MLLIGVSKSVKLNAYIKTNVKFLLKTRLLIPVFPFNSTQANGIMSSSTVLNDWKNVENANGKRKIAIIQLTCNENKENNFEICKKLITDARNEGALMAFLPEACDYIETSTKASLEKGETLEGEFITKCQKLASDLKIWISIGSFHRKKIELFFKIEDKDKSSKLFNSHVTLNDAGKIVTVYDKMHLFEANIKNGDLLTSLKESDYTIPGNQFYLPVETPVGIIGNCICYDVRFPQLSTILRKLGAHILTYPSVFTVPTGQAHWEVLLRARAIENQCYVIAAAQYGKHNEKRSSYGHSMVVDPWGKILVDCGEESPCYKIVEIDLDYLNDVRLSIPILKSYRSDLYLQIPFVRKPISEESYVFGPDIKLSNSVVFFETEYSIAFVNIKPIVPGHVVIIPKTLRQRVEEMTSEEAIDLFHTARHVAKKLEAFYNGTSLNFGIQDGPESGQSVKHVHMHVIPRRKGDFRKDEIYEKLRNHDKDMSAGLRSLEEMSQEASRLRKLFGY